MPGITSSRLSTAGSRFQIAIANGSSPLSRASEASVRFFGLNGRYRSSSRLGCSAWRIASTSSSLSRPCPGNAAENRLLPRLQVAQRHDPRLNPANLHFVEVAGPFFAIPRHERDGVPFIQVVEPRSRLAACGFACPGQCVTSRADSERRLLRARAAAANDGGGGTGGGSFFVAQYRLRFLCRLLGNSCNFRFRRMPVGMVGRHLGDRFRNHGRRLGNRCDHFDRGRKLPLGIDRNRRPRPIRQCR